MSHTPGPWHFEPQNGYGDAAVFSREKGHIAFATAGSAQELERNIANARLIAAAPDLLERLSLHADAPCLGWNKRFNLPDCGCGPCLDRAVIAKATVGQS